MRTTGMLMAAAVVVGACSIGVIAAQQVPNRTTTTLFASCQTVKRNLPLVQQRPRIVASLCGHTLSDGARRIEPA